jgi:uncharacterized protein (DUF58 family)
MGYAYPGGRSKLEYARMLAAALAFLMVRQSDSVGLVLADTAVRLHLPPASTMGNLPTMLSHLEAVPAGGGTGLGGVLEQLAPRLNRRGLVILITDGCDDPERIGSALRLLRHRRQDVRLFMLLDPDEDDFPFAGAVEFHGMEGEAPLRLDGDRVRPWYRQARAEHVKRLAALSHASGVQLVTMRTDGDPALALIQALTAPGPAVRSAP